MKFTNAEIFCIQQTMFQQYCFAHALQGAWKAAVLDLKSKDDEGKKYFLQLVLRGQIRVHLVQYH